MDLVHGILTASAATRLVTVAVEKGQHLVGCHLEIVAIVLVTVATAIILEAIVGFLAEEGSFSISDCPSAGWAGQCTALTRFLATRAASMCRRAGRGTVPLAKVSLWRSYSIGLFANATDDPAADRYGEGGYWIDGQRRRIPDHWNAHARPQGGFFDPKSSLYRRWG